MSTYHSTEPFRFLDLPGEIRNNVYNLLLCSFDDELNPEPGPISSVSRRCPSFSASSLLRTNKQIHDEAFDYMIKRNQFIRISCRGLDARGLFIDDRVPVITTDAEEVDQFNGCVMHMTLSKPVFATSSPSAFVEYDMIVLLADLPLLCEKLDIESIMADANRTTDAHASINASIKMNSTHGRFFTSRRAFYDRSQLSSAALPTSKSPALSTLKSPQPSLKQSPNRAGPTPTPPLEKSIQALTLENANGKKTTTTLPGNPGHTLSAPSSACGTAPPGPV
jgi:hypothetical protein